MQSPDSATTRLDDYIVDMLPWAHGHQRKAIRDFVRAIIDQQTGCQAQLARSFGNQEAATKRLSRLLHNERLEPRHLADAVLLQALVQLPPHGPVRLAIDWTIEGHQHLLVVSLSVGRRAVPIYWRAYDAAVLKGRMKRYEHAVIRRAVTRVIQKVGRRRVRVTADRGFADVALFTLLTDLRVAFVIRVKKSTKICLAGVWRPLHTLRFGGNTRRRTLGHLLYCADNPQRLWVTVSRKREAHGLGSLVFGGQSAVYGRASRGRVCPPDGLRSGLSRCEMVVGLCPSPHQTDQGMVASVCLMCHGTAGRRESRHPAVVAGRPVGQRLAASGRIASPQPL
jgi:hypothetical protein